jgi:hypothetical protein
MHPREGAGRRGSHDGPVLPGVKAPHRARPLRASALTLAPRGTATRLSPALTFRNLRSLASPNPQILPGWVSPTAGTTSYDELPAWPKNYIAFLDEKTGVEIGCVSTGPERNETIVRAGTKLAELLR